MNRLFWFVLGSVATLATGVAVTYLFEKKKEETLVEGAQDIGQKIAGQREESQDNDVGNEVGAQASLASEVKRGLTL